MKVAITAKGLNLSAPVDPRFGRAPYILIFDTDTLSCEVLDNSTNVNALKGAGIQAATMIADRGAQVLLTGYCGPNAFRTLEAAGTRVVTDVSGTVREALETFKSGRVVYSSGPNAEGHW